MSVQYFIRKMIKTEIQENKSPEVGDNWLDNHIRKVGFYCVIMKSKCKQ